LQNFLQDSEIGAGWQSGSVGLADAKARLKASLADGRRAKDLGWVFTRGTPRDATWLPKEEFGRHPPESVRKCGVTSKSEK
jgi:hypothetical protein